LVYYTSFKLTADRIEGFPLRASNKTRRTAE
jgi:hypothetical protein